MANKFQEEEGKLGEKKNVHKKECFGAKRNRFKIYIIQITVKIQIKKLEN